MSVETTLPEEETREQDLNLGVTGPAQIGDILPPEGETPVIAEVFATTEPREDSDVFRVVDLRSARRDSTGARIYGNHSIDPSVSFLVLGKDADLDRNTGYKGVRQTDGELVFGRFDSSTMRHDDYRGRFATSPTTSREHFSLKVNDSGSLEVKDERSTNGTTLRILGREADKTQAIGLDSAEQELPPTKEVRTQDFIDESKQSERTKEFLNSNETVPIKEVKVGDSTFYLSPVHNGERRFAVLYARQPDTEEGTYIPRLLWKSNSEGGWRVTRLVMYDGHINKGNFPDNGGYTQETKPADEIVEALEELEASSDGLVAPEGPTVTLKFSPEDILGKDGDTYDEEVRAKYLNVPELFEQSPGSGFVYKDGRPAREHFAELDLPENYMPDFSTEPVRTMERQHTMLGKIKVEVFAHNINGNDAEWYIASDQEGRVWVDKIKDTKAKVNSYGMYDSIVLAGLLNNKPVEYLSQINGLVERVDYHRMGNHYADITPLLDNLPLVKNYREARKVFRPQ